MSAALEFLVGLLDLDDPVFVTQEDFDGVHGKTLRRVQAMGFLGREPGVNPVPACPHCGEGVPRRLRGRYVCDACYSAVDPARLFAWQVDREAFLRWLAVELRIGGEVRCVGRGLWQLGRWDGEGGPCECFFLQGGSPAGSGQDRLGAYRNFLVLYGLTRPQSAGSPGRAVSLLEVLRLQGGLGVADPSRLFQVRGNVRFEPHSGALLVGDAILGEVPVASKEYFLLRRLAEDIDHYVPYSDLKAYVLRQSGSRDATEEATFCHGLKSRIKKKWMPRIDRVLATTNKAEGYRLRGYAEL
jgi:hypothetical protein